MPVIAPETTARQALISALSKEFEAEQFPIKDDKLHGSLGNEGTIIGVYPERSISDTKHRIVNDYYIVVQFYGKYNLETDPKQSVSPSTIETYAERFRQRLKTGGVDPRTGSVWYFTLVSIMYPDDPTGNKSRFEAHLVARGNNTALI